MPQDKIHVDDLPISRRSPSLLIINATCNASEGEMGETECLFMKIKWGSLKCRRCHLLHGLTD